jgi:hypothetical protein
MVLVEGKPNAVTMNLQNGRNLVGSSNGWQFPQAIRAEASAISASLRQGYGATSVAYSGLAWFTEPKLVRRQDRARLRVASRRYGAASFACIHERRMVDQTGIEPVTS